MKAATEALKSCCFPPTRDFQLVVKMKTNSVRKTNATVTRKQPSFERNYTHRRSFVRPDSKPALNCFVFHNMIWLIQFQIVSGKANMQLQSVVCELCHVSRFADNRLFRTNPQIYNSTDTDLNTRRHAYWNQLILNRLEQVWLRCM